MIASLPHACPPWASERENLGGETLLSMSPRDVVVDRIWMVLVYCLVWLAGRRPPTSIFRPGASPVEEADLGQTPLC